MHVVTLVHGDPRNFKNFEKWINSLDYGSRAFCRRFALMDINIQEKHLPNLLGDLKYYYKSDMVQAYDKSRQSWIKKFMNFVIKIMKLKKIDIDSVEKTPKKWFKGMEFEGGSCSGFYLYPLGGFPDIVRNGHEEI